MRNDSIESLRAFINEHAEVYDHAVTLTLKQRDGPSPLDRQLAVKNLGHFLNRMNKKAFRNAAVRHSKKIPVFPMLERSLAGRWHYHLAIQNPFRDTATCGEAVSKCWSETRWGYSEIDVRPLYDTEGWINYITKSRSIEGWDIVNTTLTC